MAARLVRRTVEEFIEDKKPLKAAEREADPRDEELDEALEDLGDVEDDDDAEPAPRRRRR